MFDFLLGTKQRTRNYNRRWALNDIPSIPSSASDPLPPPERVQTQPESPGIYDEISSDPRLAYQNIAQKTAPTVPMSLPVSDSLASPSFAFPNYPSSSQQSDAAEDMTFHFDPDYSTHIVTDPRPLPTASLKQTETQHTPLNTSIHSQAPPTPNGPLNPPQSIPQATHRFASGHRYTSSDATRNTASRAPIPTPTHQPVPEGLPSGDSGVAPSPWKSLMDEAVFLHQHVSAARRGFTTAFLQRLSSVAQTVAQTATGTRPATSTPSIASELAQEQAESERRGAEDSLGPHIVYIPTSSLSSHLRSHARLLYAAAQVGDLDTVQTIVGRYVPLPPVLSRVLGEKARQEAVKHLKAEAEAAGKAAAGAGAGTGVARTPTADAASATVTASSYHPGSASAPATSTPAPAAPSAAPSASASASASVASTPMMTGGVTTSATSASSSSSSVTLQTRRCLRILQLCLSITHEHQNLTPVLTAASTGRLQVLEYLLSVTSYRLTSAVASPLSGICYNNPNMLQYYDLQKSKKTIVPLYRSVLSAGILSSDIRGLSALHYAARNGHTSVMASILLHGLEIDIMDNNKTTPLMLAAGAGKIGAVELCIQSGASVNAINTYGDSALQLSCLRGHADITELLLHCNADLTVTGMNGRTPLGAAADKGHWACVEVLVAYGADVETLEQSIYQNSYNISFDHDDGDFDDGSLPRSSEWLKQCLSAVQRGVVCRVSMSTRIGVESERIRYNYCDLYTRSMVNTSVHGDINAKTVCTGIVPDNDMYRNRSADAAEDVSDIHRDYIPSAPAPASASASVPASASASPAASASPSGAPPTPAAVADADSSSPSAKPTQGTPAPMLPTPTTQGTLAPESAAADADAAGPACVASASVAGSPGVGPAGTGFASANANDGCVVAGKSTSSGSPVSVTGDAVDDASVVSSLHVDDVGPVPTPAPIGGHGQTSTVTRKNRKKGSRSVKVADIVSGPVILHK